MSVLLVFLKIPFRTHDVCFSVCFSAQAAQALYQIIFGRDSCLRAVLCYKDSIYKGLYGKQKKNVYFVIKVDLL